MADTDRSRSGPSSRETSDTERERVRSSNDHDQEAEREGVESEHNRGYDDAVRGSGTRDRAEEEFEDIDPDSARSDVDRDDTIDDV
jgi:hypothetical protein